MSDLTTTERVGISLLLAAIIGLIAFDVWTDWRSGASARHMSIEVVIGLLALVGVAVVWSRSLFLSHRVARLSQALEVAKADASRWKENNAHLLQGLSAAIDRQFDEWKLTAAEKEIALLLLKGLSLKEIAQLRRTSERTVRQQSVGLYGKSGLAGRAELAAFFLEDLMPPPLAGGRP